MLRKLGPALLVVIGLFSGSGASASPLTFYTDEASWLTAVSGFTVGTYPYGVTYTGTLVNVGLLPDGGCCIVSTPPPIFSGYPPVIGAHFTSVDITFSSMGVDNCFYPSQCTFATDVMVNFPTPVYGFASSASGAMVLAEISINGQELPLPSPPFNNLFFGVTGLINSLDFTSSTNPVDDEDVFIRLPDIVVAGNTDFRRPQSPGTTGSHRN
jgi:hypothetical protein